MLLADRIAPEEIYQLSFADSQTGWAVGRRGVYKTVDGGVHWVKPDNEPIQSEGWVESASGLLESTNDLLRSVVNDQDVVLTKDEKLLGRRIRRSELFRADGWIYYYKEQADDADDNVYGEAGIYKIRYDGSGLTKLVNTTYNWQDLGDRENREISNFDSEYIQMHKNEFALPVFEFVKVDDNFIYYKTNFNYFQEAKVSIH